MSLGPRSRDREVTLTSTTSFTAATGTASSGSNGTPASTTYTSGSTNDATSTYTIAAPSAPTGNLPLYVPLAGYSIGGGQEWGQRAYALVVTGNSTKYNATVQVDVGIGYGPIDITTMSR